VEGPRDSACDLGEGKDRRADIHAHFDGQELDTGVVMAHPGFAVRREESLGGEWDLDVERWMSVDWTSSP
jgi:hypothetical protein